MNISMNVIIRGDYVLIKPQGLSKFFSKIFKPEFDSIINKEYSLQDSQLAIIEKIDNEKLFVRIVGQLKPLEINLDNLIKKVEPSDYDNINKCSFGEKRKSIGLYNGIILVSTIAVLLQILFPELQSQKTEHSVVLIVFIVILLLYILMDLKIRTGKTEKQKQKDLWVFEQRYKNDDM